MGDPPSGNDLRRWRSACELAGRFAEMGVARVDLEIGATRCVLVAGTDTLPERLYAAEPGAILRCAAGAWILEDRGWRPVETS